MVFSVDLTVTELRSKERKLSRQIEVIKKALSEIGCDELPNGWDLDNSFDQGNEIQVRGKEIATYVEKCFVFLVQFKTERKSVRYV